MNITGHRLHRTSRSAARGLGRAVGVPLLAAVVLAVAVTVFPDCASAAAPGPVAPGPDPIETVVDNIRNWLVGILVTVATLFLTIAGVRIMASNGDPGENEKGKRALKSAALGYALALLAPLLVTIVDGWMK